MSELEYFVGCPNCGEELCREPVGAKGEFLCKNCGCVVRFQILKNGVEAGIIPEFL